MFCSISLFGGSNQKYQAVEILFPIATFRACLFRKKKTTEKIFFYSFIYRCERITLTRSGVHSVEGVSVSGTLALGKLTTVASNRKFRYVKHSSKKVE